MTAQEENLSNFINRYKSDVSNMQVSYEKLYHENQATNHVILRLKREMGSLKEDLSFKSFGKHTKLFLYQSALINHLV